MADGLQIGLLIFLLGQAPLWTNIIVVEKHYTSFYTGFWNLYFVSISFIGTAVLTGNSTLFAIGLLIAVTLLVVYENEIDRRNKVLSDIVRNLGSSAIAASIGVGIFAFGITNSFFALVVFTLGHFTFVYLFSDEIRELLK